MFVSSSASDTGSSLVAPDPQSLRHAFGGFATGVCVLGGETADGARLGITLNSFTSVSLDPALLLVSLGRFLRSHDALVGISGFAISVLSEGQQEVADRFARRDGPKWQDFGFLRGAAGGLMVDGALACFDCRHHRSVPAGDHTLLIGEVLAISHDPDRHPLLFHRGAYRRF